MQKSSLVREKDESGEELAKISGLGQQEWVDFILHNSTDHRGYKQPLF